MKALTIRQAEILAYIASQAIPPTVREICAHFGFRSPFAATQHLDALEAKGAIKRDRRKARAIEVARPATDAPRQSCGQATARPLTRRQAEVLAYIASRPIPPTLRKICAHFGFRSVHAATVHLDALQAKGAIARGPRKARAIEVAAGLPDGHCRTRWKSQPSGS